MENETKICLNCNREKATSLFVCYGGTGDAHNMGICRVCYTADPKSVSKWYENELKERRKAASANNR